MSSELLRVGLAWLIRRHLRRWWREIEIRIGVRKITPRRGERLPDRLVDVPELPRDTGGAYRPKHRPQDPSKDPHEPYGSEGSSRGSDHGWSNCTMSSSADALAYATRGKVAPWGGDMRHRQGDLEGGTDLYDAQDAFEAYGERLTIRSGAGWSALVAAHNEGRAIVIQGEGQVPGAGDFTGGHACCIGVETHSGGDWLFGDPLASDWQWIHPSSIKTWAERWQSSIAFAVTDLPPDPNPEPGPDPAPPDSGGAPCPPAEAHTPAELKARQDHAAGAAVAARDGELVAWWRAWLVAPAEGPADRWDAGSWGDRMLELVELVDEGVEPDPCEELAPARWSRGEIPFPAAEAIASIETPATWDGSVWLGGTWRGSSAVRSLVERPRAF